MDEAGEPIRIDKAFSWEAPLGLHGMMHTVIGNAGAGDPYPIDTLFMFMANMAWNSAMNPGETTRILTEKRADGEYVIPHVIYSDAYFSETVPYADLILPDTTYLERWDCISILDRPIGSAHGAGDAIRQPVIKPDRDVRPFQDVLIELGARLGLPAFVKEDGSPRYKDYADYIVNHERMPGVGPLAGFRGADGTQEGQGRAEPGPAQALRRERLLLARPPAAGAGLLQVRQPRLPRTGQGDGADRQRRADRAADLVGAACRNSAWPPRGTARCSRPTACASASAPTATRCRSGTRRWSTGRRTSARFAHLGHHPAADGALPFLGLDERLAAADPRLQPALHGAVAGRGRWGSARTTGSGWRAAPGASSASSG